jgi:hypothetical protein
MSSKRCPSCGVYSPATTELCDCGQSLLGVGAGTGARRTQATQAIGALLMAAGVALWAFCFVAYDISVAVPPATQYSPTTDRVVNMERLDTRQNGIVVGSALFIAGAVLFASGKRDG